MMRNLFLLLFILTFAASCSNKPKGQGSFKFVVGNRALDVFFAGGAYVEATDTATSIPTMYTLDATNSFTIPYGSYNLLVVTFSGPGINMGTMLCGSLTAVNFNSPDSTQTITINAAECSKTIYTKLISSLTQGIIPQWDSGKWDLNHWGP
jgi:hypothetical protein